MTVREYDEHCERIMNSFLMKHFYEKYFNGNVERVTNKAQQVKGVDAIITDGEKKYLVDEKAAIRYVGLKTFALELSFFNRKGNLMTGWLLDDEKVNDHYLFVWINELNDKEIINEDSIKDVDIALVSKESILNYLSSIGWNKDNLMIKDYQIRNEENTYMGNIRKNGCKFAYSEHLYEKPINILLPKEKYMEIAELAVNVSV
jgi:hypothetical protein